VSDALVDERRPGWAAAIDRGRLRMSSCLECVLGQLYGEYERGKGALGIDGAFDEGGAYDLGFNAIAHEYPALRRLWLEEIDRRVPGGT
jgi:hypothetical protein